MSMRSLDHSFLSEKQMWVQAADQLVGVFQTGLFPRGWCAALANEYTSTVHMHAVEP